MPDVAVFLEDTKAENRDSHWFGGPDFSVEIITPGDRTREKIPFYEKVRARELLIIDRNPWALELYRYDGEKLSQAGRSTLDEDRVLNSELLGLNFELIPSPARPKLRIRYPETGRRWVV